MTPTPIFPLKNAAQSTTAVVNTPLLSSDDDLDFCDIYILYYRQGHNPYPMTKFFTFKGTLQKAIDRGRQHCEYITARFLRVEPFVHDLTEDEVSSRSDR